MNPKGLEAIASAIKLRCMNLTRFVLPFSSVPPADQSPTHPHSHHPIVSLSLAARFLKGAQSLHLKSFLAMYKIVFRIKENLKNSTPT